MSPGAFRFRWANIGASRTYWLPELLVTLLLLGIGVVLSAVGNLDARLLQPFELAHGGERWPLEHMSPWHQFYQYAGVGTMVMVAAAVGVLAASYASPRFRRMRIYAVYLLLVLGLGPGLLVNGLLKENWGRPRPRETVQFGGWREPRSILQPKAGQGHSFPCGHCSVTFSVSALYFVFRRRRPRLAAAALLLSLALGTLMSIARMAAGAHYPSDTLVSALLVFLVALAMYYFILQIPAREDAEDDRALAPGPVFAVVTLLMVAGLVMGAFMAIPVRRTVHHERGLYAPISPDAAVLDVREVDVDIRFAEQPHLLVNGVTEGFRGLGGGLARRLYLEPEGEGATAVVFRAWTQGLFSDLHSRLTVHVAAPPVKVIRIVARDAIIRLPDRPRDGVAVQVEAQGCRIEMPPTWQAQRAGWRLQGCQVAVPTGTAEP